MRVYISSDIEGTCGLCGFAETDPENPCSTYFRQQMTREVAAAALGAQNGGAEDVFIKDTNYSGRGIIPDMLPPKVQVMRGNANDIYGMMSGINVRKFDAVMMTGYHSPAKDDANPLAHNAVRHIETLKINDQIAGEFALNAYTAGYFGIPVSFISGDKGICDMASELIPGVVSVPVQEGFGGATIAISPSEAVRLILEGSEKSIKDEYYKKCAVKMPQSFEIGVAYESRVEAYRNSFYPGVIQVAPKKIRFKSTNYLDVLRFIHFCING